MVQLYFKASAANFVAAGSGGTVLLVLSLDWLFFYYMPGYSGAVERYLWFVLPTAVLTIPVCLRCCSGVCAASMRNSRSTTA